QPRRDEEEHEFESRVLGYTRGKKNDPFRGIKITDGMLAPDSTIISQIRNVTKDRNGLWIQIRVLLHPVLVEGR
ncbi:unnamed protein product, partial [marine sediment metagenome]